ncbi:kynurenine formamidase isoform X1 [Rhinatrema bivittatum]|uniref:kynurenine formamidase isoform X1 n=1 Tax=Rhinatrema bivittatum TaxID=194408 RepID=UPI00112743A4|nr:kynurenine formamidase isoform X1 [Rhinatrema bivittatum]
MESWRELQKEELEYQYSPSRWSPRMDKDAVIEAHVRLTSEGTKKSQSMTETLLNVPYGALEGEKMDIYLPLHSSGAFPFFIYVHGGYWQFLSKEESGFMAPPLLRKGIAVVALGYDIAPKGDMDLMVSQVRRGIAFVARQYPCISGLYLCGHSAGAHLVAMALSTDWTDYGVKPEIKGAFLVSGVYDLLPITHTYVNAPLCMSEEIAVRNSPMQHVREVKSQAETCRIVVVLAEHDTAEFCRQSQEYSQNLQALGLNVCLRDINGVDHFDVIEKLSQEDYVLTQIILNMILRE